MGSRLALKLKFSPNRTNNFGRYSGNGCKFSDISVPSKYPKKHAYKSKLLGVYMVSEKKYSICHNRRFKKFQMVKTSLLS